MNITPLFSQAHLSLHTPHERGLHQQSPLTQEQERSTKEQAEIAKLQTRDREVRAHEQAHLAAAGGLAQGGATFSFQRGPDGKQYAVGGEVSIDTSSVSGNPEATIRKAQQIRAAALSPANPSGQDRAMAASAGVLEAHAHQELKKEEQDANADEKENATSPSSPRIDLFV